MTSDWHRAGALRPIMEVPWRKIADCRRRRRRRISSAAAAAPLKPFTSDGSEEHQRLRTVGAYRNMRTYRSEVYSEKPHEKPLGGRRDRTEPSMATEHMTPYFAFNRTGFAQLPVLRSFGSCKWTSRLELYEC